MEPTALPPVGQSQYLGGAKLLMTMISITLVGFLMLLDTSIVSTVSSFNLFIPIDYSSFPSLTALHFISEH